MLAPLKGRFAKQRSVDVDLWVWRPKVSPQAVRDAWRLLDEHERDRAERFVQRTDADRYVVIHGAMRRVLGSYCGAGPRDLRFATTGQQKPILPGGPAFNLSHSADWAALAVTQSTDIELGVDIEVIRPLEPDVLPIVFSPPDLKRLARAPARHLDRAVIQGWTRKEAVLKASGEGLHCDPREVSVGLTDDEVLLQNVPPSFGTTDQWALSDIDLGAGLAGCVAAQTSGAPLRIKRMPASDL